MIVRWGSLSAIEPTAEQVAAVAGELVTAYNDPKNAALLGHTTELVVDDVIEHYAKLRRDAHPFLLFDGDQLAGDADLRDVKGGACEFAFMIARPAAQGKGLGTRFATMIHAFAFQHLGLERVYATVVPENVASLRVFEKLGYVVDDTTELGDEGDVVLRIDRAAFVGPSDIAIA